MKIRPVAANSSITGIIASPGRWNISATVPWQKFRPWLGLSDSARKRRMPSAEPITCSTPLSPPTGYAGSCGWQARRTPARSAAGTSPSTRNSIASQPAFSVTGGTSRAIFWPHKLADPDPPASCWLG